MIGIRTYFLTAVAIFLVGWAVLDAQARKPNDDACASAKALHDGKLYADSIAAYVKVLKADPTASCAMKALTAPNSLYAAECDHANAVGVGDPGTARKELAKILATDTYADGSCIVQAIARFPEPAPEK